MVGFAFSEIFFLMALALGSGHGLPAELGQFIEPADYFAPRSIETKPDVLLAVATKASTDPKDSINQLLAIRWLGENKDGLGDKKEGVRKGLQQVVAGKDENAAHYARIALAKIDGKPIPSRSFPKNSVRLQALEWFPDEVTFACGMDLRAPPAKASEGFPEELAKLLLQARNQLNKSLPNQAKDEIYLFAESVGNVRIDRFAFAYAPDPQGQQGKDHLYFRVTGQVHHARLLDYLKMTLPNATFDEKKGAKGEPITTFKMENFPLMVLVGDTELLVAGFSGSQDKAEKPMEMFLETRAGKNMGATKGPLAKLFALIPEDVSGLALGQVPAEIRSAFAMLPNSPPVPDDFSIMLAQARPGKTGVEFIFRGAMANEGDAKKFVEAVKELVKMANDQVKNIPQGVPAPALNLMTQMLKMLESLELKSEGSKVTVTLPISLETQKALLPLIQEVIKMEGIMP